MAVNTCLLRSLLLWGILSSVQDRIWLLWLLSLYQLKSWEASVPFREGRKHVLPAGSKTKNSRLLSKGVTRQDTKQSALEARSGHELKLCLLPCQCRGLGKYCNMAELHFHSLQGRGGCSGCFLGFKNGHQNDCVERFYVPGAIKSVCVCAYLHLHIKFICVCMCVCIYYVISCISQV